MERPATDTADKLLTKGESPADSSNMASKNISKAIVSSSFQNRNLKLKLFVVSQDALRI